MRKKSKVILLLILVIGIALNPFKKVNAHSIELDPELLISMPYMITGGRGTVTIKSSITDYTLYFQAVQIPSTVYSEIEKTQTDGETSLNTLTEACTALETEVNNFKETYVAASDAYKEGLKNTELSEAELEKLKTTCETAKTNYQNKITEYKSKFDEKESKATEIDTKIKELTPTYIENNWTQTTNNKISLDTTQFSGEQPYAIWIKLVTSDGTYYDEGIYKMRGTKAPNVNVTGISLDNTTLSIENGSSYTLTTVITPDDATNKTLKWSSDNESVATVSDGKITAKSAGTATITVTTIDGEYTATCKVTVTEKKDATTPKKEETTVPKKEETTTPKKEDTTVPKKDDNTVDTSTAKGTLPKAGISSIGIIFVVGISFLGIIFYKKYKYLNIK